MMKLSYINLYIGFENFYVGSILVQDKSLT